ncbi:putative RNA polymerase I-specific transcription initiation factor RRN3 [Paratrimastix pyriformis]|uniref:RNA polymerase I-specific transcription initiation factor RRN3 n=1 Tax=Paratrimastix pyriformis TaxID=342808 RepID=A0ABQ8UJY8_9EUKA|nr:putative RNA polymerase I-specific transcription initiation factor RRN3 [Paratrimastix pyriformis]
MSSSQSRSRDLSAANLASYSGAYIIPLFKKLVAKFTPTSSAAQNPETGKKLQEVHTTIEHILHLVPSSNAPLFDILADAFPHRRIDLETQRFFLSNLLSVCTYSPILHDRIVGLIVDRLLEIDVELEDIEDASDPEAALGLDEQRAHQQMEVRALAEKLDVMMEMMLAYLSATFRAAPRRRMPPPAARTTAAVPRPATRTNPAQPRMPSTLATSTLAIPRIASGSQSRAIPIRARPEPESPAVDETLGTSVGMAMSPLVSPLPVNPATDISRSYSTSFEAGTSPATQSIIISPADPSPLTQSSTSAFGRLASSPASGHSSPAVPTPPPRIIASGLPDAESLFNGLMRTFDSSIISTHKSKYTQFLVFFACALQPQFGDLFLTHMLERLSQRGLHSQVRQAVAAYIGSFAARSSYISRETTRIKFGTTVFGKNTQDQDPFFLSLSNPGDGSLCPPPSRAQPLACLAWLGVGNPPGGIGGPPFAGWLASGPRELCGSIGMSHASNQQLDHFSHIPRPGLTCPSRSSLTPGDHQLAWLLDSLVEWLSSYVARVSPPPAMRSSGASSSLTSTGGPRRPATPSHLFPGRTASPPAVPGGFLAAVSSENHMVFYSAMQALLYIVCFKYRRFPAEVHRILMGVDWWSLLGGALRTLQVCNEAICLEFAHLMYSLGIFDCRPLLRSAQQRDLLGYAVSGPPPLEGDILVQVGVDGTGGTGAVLSVLSGCSGCSDTQQLLSYFPFDLCSASAMPRMNRCCTALYQEWEAQPPATPAPPPPSPCPAGTMPAPSALSPPPPPTSSPSDRTWAWGSIGAPASPGLDSPTLGLRGRTPPPAAAAAELPPAPIVEPPLLCGTFSFLQPTRHEEADDTDEEDEDEAQAPGRPAAAPTASTAATATSSPAVVAASPGLVLDYTVPDLFQDSSLATAAVAAATGGQDDTLGDEEIRLMRLLQQQHTSFEIEDICILPRFFNILSLAPSSILVFSFPCRIRGLRSLPLLQSRRTIAALMCCSNMNMCLSTGYKGRARTFY